MKRTKKKTIGTGSLTTTKTPSRPGKRKGRPHRASKRSRTAHHEAAHTITAKAVGLHVDEVSISPGEDYLGRCTGPNAIYGYDVPATRSGQSKLARDQAIVLYAGLAAENLFFGVPFAFDDSAKHGAWSDHDQARALMGRHYSRRNPNAMLNVQKASRRLVCKHRAAIARLAELLIVRRTIRGAELQRLLTELTSGTCGVGSHETESHVISRPVGAKAPQAIGKRPTRRSRTKPPSASGGGARSSVASLPHSATKSITVRVQRSSWKPKPITVRVRVEAVKVEPRFFTAQVSDKNGRLRPVKMLGWRVDMQRIAAPSTETRPQTSVARKQPGTMAHRRRRRLTKPR